MKDSEFIELLNLYLDHEITAADAARLEAEVQRDPARRQIYRQYCQMQKACSMLAADFAAEPTAEKVVAFDAPARSAWRPVLWGATGLAAAAACVAFVFLNRTPDIAPSTKAVVAVVEPQTLPPVAGNSETRAITRTVSLPPMRRAELQPVLTASTLVLSGNQDAVTLAPAQFEWMNGVKLVPITPSPGVDELLRFERHSTLKPETPLIRSARPPQANVEMTAFQFQK